MHDQDKPPISSAAHDGPAIPSAAVDEVRVLLNLSSSAEDVAVLNQLTRAAVDYATHRSVLLLYGSPKEQRRQIEKLVRTVDRALVTLVAIAPEYQVTLDAMMDWERPEPESGPGGGMKQRLLSVRNAAAVFLRRYHPKLGAAADLPLEEAIRALLPIIDVDLGRPVTTAQNKRGEDGPMLASIGAQAIAVLLRAVDPKLQRTKIVNMIDKVRRQPEETESHFEAIFRADPLSDFDMALGARLTPEERVRIRDQ